MQGRHPFTANFTLEKPPRYKNIDDNLFTVTATFSALRSTVVNGLCLILRMLCFLLLVTLVTSFSTHAQNTNSDTTNVRATSHTPDALHGREKDIPSGLLRPRIHYCRSPNMETFTCWWHLPGNGSHSNSNVTYTLTYSVGKGPKRECPDYVTGGVNSCYFDSHHTQVWEIYCMNVMACSRHGNYTSEDHCLDVVDIVETDPPFNLTYWLTNSSEEESGRTAVVAWLYPNAADVHMGWVTLVFELQYRRKTEPHNWKVKGVMREPRLELLELPAGSYVVRVRCKSHNSRLWSKWSDPLTINIPPHQTKDNKLAVILVAGIGVMAFLMIGFGVIPQGKRIKAFLLPPVPKPRIRGIDPTLLKTGKMEEITRLFKSFHDYSPPQNSVENWLQITTEDEQSLKGSPLAKSAEVEDERPICPEDQLMGNEGPSRYCGAPSQGLVASSPALPVESSSWAWPTPGPGNADLLTVHNLGYTVVLSPIPALALTSCQDLYTCVNRVNTSGAVQLAPCLPSHLRNASYLQLKDSSKKDMTEESNQLAMCKAKQRGLVVNVPSVDSRCTTGALAGEVGDSYTTMDDLSLNRKCCVDAAPAHGDRKEGILCSEQSDLPGPLLPAVTEGI
ncbi:hypothetical protein AAFF_G00194250 [Aldrovandia affinis]|uniref:Fibronectin type-III domain-containing protein n=1 Tax=Aldrovandia affinis TaxID=143900 RepID=A0AAD7SXH8_9TELE|nr:hypothetical protein AAFF_G00194250 [Aldrovandia affinis]